MAERSNAAPKNSDDSILRTPLGLRGERGPMGQLLRQLPLRALEAAEKRRKPWEFLGKWIRSHPVERDYATKEGMNGQEIVDAECVKLVGEGFKRTGVGVYSADAATRRITGIREVRFFFHNHDPNRRCKRVIMAGAWPSSICKTLEAAASQHAASLRLAEIGRDGGSVLTSFREKLGEAQTRGDLEAANYWSNKVSASILKRERGRKWLLDNPSFPPEIRKEARRRYERFYAADVRRLGRKKADEKWKASESPIQKAQPLKLRTIGERIATAMALDWLDSRLSGFPGFCFHSDEALATVLGLRLNLRGLGWKTVRTTRERIGLKKGEILVTGVEEIGGGKWAVVDPSGAKLGWFQV